MVRSGLGKTRLAVRSVALSAPLLAVSTLPMKIASPYVDVHTLGGKRQFDRAMYGARGTLIAWSRLAKHERFRDGAATEVLSKALSSLNSSLENGNRTKALAICFSNLQQENLIILSARK